MQPPALPLTPSGERARAAREALEALGDPRVRRARTLLLVIAIAYAVLAVASPIAYGILFARNTPAGEFGPIPPAVAGAISGLFLDVVFLPLGASALAGAIGLPKGERWGHVFGCIAFALFTFVIPPVGILGLHALLRASVRGVFHPASTKP